MNRYIDSVDKIRTNGTIRFETIYYPEFPISDSDIYLITKKSDRLDLLADEYYNDSTLWWIILRANQNQLTKGTLRVPVGVKIRIPYPLDDYDILDLIRKNQY